MILNIPNFELDDLTEIYLFYSFSKRLFQMAWISILLDDGYDDLIMSREDNCTQGRFIYFVCVFHVCWYNIIYAWSSWCHSMNITICSFPSRSAITKCYRTAQWGVPLIIDDCLMECHVVWLLSIPSIKLKRLIPIEVGFVITIT